MAIVLVRTRRNHLYTRPRNTAPSNNAPATPLRASQRPRVHGCLGLIALALGAIACRPNASPQPASYPPGYPPSGYPPNSYPPPNGHPPNGYPPGAHTAAPPNAPPATWGLPLPPGFVLPPPIAWFPPGGPLPAPPAAPPGPTPPPGATAWSAVEQEVLARVNAQRARGAQCGSQTFGPAAPLEPHPALLSAARGHSADMAANDYFDHASRDGRTMVTRVRAAGYAGGAVGENIAAGSATAEAAVSQWVQSPGHCSNLMSREFRFLGVGHAYRAGTRFGHYWTQNFGG